MSTSRSTRASGSSAGAHWWARAGRCPCRCPSVPPMGTARTRLPGGYPRSRPARSAAEVGFIPRQALALLVTSPRVGPGLMALSAWSAVASASGRLASSDTPPVWSVRGCAPSVDIVAGAGVHDLLEAARHDDVVWLADDAEAERFPTALATAIVDAGGGGGGGGVEVEIEVLHASYDVPGARLLDLVTVMDRLRTDCPWDREQTHRSLARYLLEETYETLEVIESDDYTHLREELGDLLLQVYFHARIAEEEPEGFSIDDVAGGIVDKLVHRLPHVFAGLDVADVDEVERNWESLKATEKSRASVLDGIPVNLPALALAEKVLGRAARVGVAPSARVGVTPTAADTLGDRLLALVVEARSSGADAEQALREAVRALATRV